MRFLKPPYKGFVTTGKEKKYCLDNIGMQLNYDLGTAKAKLFEEVLNLMSWTWNTRC